MLLARIQEGNLELNLWGTRELLQVALDGAKIWEICISKGKEKTVRKDEGGEAWW